MAQKVLLIALFLGGIFAGSAAANPNDKPSKDATKAERKAVSVPEPSALLLIGMGVSGAIAFGAWQQRRGSKS